MELEPTLIVSSVNLGTTIYGCYVETIDNTVYSFLRNTALLQPTEDHFETTSIKFDKSYGRYTDYGIYKMSIPFYNISSKAIAGYGFDRSPLNTDSTQSFRGNKKINNDTNWQYAKRFGFGRIPYVADNGIRGDSTYAYNTHHFKLLSDRYIVDNNEVIFTNQEPAVTIYVMKSKDTTCTVTETIPCDTDKAYEGVPLFDDQTGLCFGIASYNDGKLANGGSYITYCINLSGNVSSSISLENNKVHIYRVEVGADFDYNIYTDGDNIPHVIKLDENTEEYKVYKGLVVTYTRDGSDRGFEGLAMACYAHDFISENNYYASSNDAAGTLHANDYTFYVSGAEYMRYAKQDSGRTNQISEDSIRVYSTVTCGGIMGQTIKLAPYYYDLTFSPSTSTGRSGTFTAKVIVENAYPGLGKHNEKVSLLDATFTNNRGSGKISFEVAAADTSYPGFVVGDVGN